MQVSDTLRKREEASDAQRKKMEAAINQVRLKKANELLHKLSHADQLIDEMVKHTMKVIVLKAHGLICSLRQD